MRFYLISDNVDTQVGMRLAGIEGTVAHEAQEEQAALVKALADPDIAMILVTEKLMTQFGSRFDQVRQEMSRPLIVEIPDRHGAQNGKDRITRYVRDAIGVKI